MTSCTGHLRHVVPEFCDVLYEFEDPEVCDDDIHLDLVAALRMQMVRRVIQRELPVRTLDELAEQTRWYRDLTMLALQFVTVKSAKS